MAGAAGVRAVERGVRIMGDVAIYVSPASADHLAHPQLFQDGYVAGAPPDAYAVRGQLWGNPLYDWPALQRRGYRWWVERVRRTLELFDVARIDHFRGFRRVLGGPGGRADRGRREVAARTRQGAVRGARAVAGRRSAARRRGPWA